MRQIVTCIILSVMVLSSCRKSETLDNGLEVLSGTVWYGESADGQFGLQLSFSDDHYCKVTTGALDDTFSVNVQSFVYERGYGIDLFLYEYNDETKVSAYYVGKFDDENNLTLSRSIGQTVLDELPYVLRKERK